MVKEMAIKILNSNKRKVQVNILEKILCIAENKVIMKSSPFFYE